jgi:hypothetical protein
MIDDQEGSMRSDLKVLVDADRKPLWDGKVAIEVREATVRTKAYTIFERRCGERVCG